MGKYIFMAGGDACEACAALAGAVTDYPLGPQHDHCECDSAPLDDDCPTYDSEQVGTERYGPDGGSARIFFELTVTCCDGSTIGETFEIDLGEEPGDRTIDELSDEIDGDLDAEAEGLADGCPGDPGGNVV